MQTTQVIYSLPSNGIKILRPMAVSARAEGYGNSSTELFNATSLPTLPGQELHPRQDSTLGATQFFLVFSRTSSLQRSTYERSLHFIYIRRLHHGRRHVQPDSACIPELRLGHDGLKNCARWCDRMWRDCTGKFGPVEIGPVLMWYQGVPYSYTELPIRLLPDYVPLRYFHRCPRALPPKGDRSTSQNNKVRRSFVQLV